MTASQTLVHQPGGAGLNEMSDASWAQLERRADYLSKASYLPEAYRGKPGNIIAAGLALASIGRDLTPMTLKLVYVINGTVDFMYDLIAAQVHEHGHEIWVVENELTHATVAGQRRGSSRVHEVTYTTEQAQRSGLMGKDTYKKWLEDMLVARAGKRCAKRVCPEALLSLPPPMRFAETPTGRVEVVSFDSDDDPVDAEIVGDGGSPGRSPADGGDAVDSSGVAGSSPTSVAAATHVDVDPETGEVLADADPPCPATADEWRALAVAHGVKTPTLLRRAREIAVRVGVAPPVDMDAVVECDEIAQELAAWVAQGGVA